MIDYQRLFHVGVRTPELESAMGELGSAMGLTWAAVREVEAQPVWTPDQGLHEVGLRFVYSCEGPQHVELLEGEPGSVWDGRDQPGVHHVGIWVDDVVAEVERGLAQGWAVVAANAPPADGYGFFAYLAPPSGMIVEVVSTVIEPAFAAWWAAGPDPAADPSLDPAADPSPDPDPGPDPAADPSLAPAADPSPDPAADPSPDPDPDPEEGP